MDGLTSLDGLGGLLQVQSMLVAGCDGLTSLAGAPALTHVNTLTVTGNSTARAGCVRGLRGRGVERPERLLQRRVRLRVRSLR